MYNGRMGESPRQGEQGRKGEFADLVKPLALALTIVASPPVFAKEHPIGEVEYAQSEKVRDEDSFATWFRLRYQADTAPGRERRLALAALKAYEARYKDRLNSWQIRRALLLAQHQELVRHESIFLARLAESLGEFLRGRDAVIADGDRAKLETALRGFEQDESPAWKRARSDLQEKYFKAYDLLSRIFDAKDDALASIVRELQEVDYHSHAVIVKLSLRLPQVTDPSAAREYMKELQDILDQMAALTDAQRAELFIRGYLEGEREGSAHVPRKDGPTRIRF